MRKKKPNKSNQRRAKNLGRAERNRSEITQSKRRIDQCPVCVGGVGGKRERIAAADEITESRRDGGHEREEEEGVVLVHRQRQPAAGRHQNGKTPIHPHPPSQTKTHTKKIR